ncbi:dimethyl sulfoxide reductase anchor subunit family protein [Pseudodesulfovibrio tunisiensis]|uniref:dimethyl sulfoxide reductase anchor subunit family protein n=1 Tax=Pseudodesulfovibrio tunisiensis TaxID=463192 RepID=UPI001FB3221C|nr:DmsC/YnfH family molybdoenzyme membrane anchor subunit [Pseudodesulfovibrio tunisiensis]
MVFNEWSLVLFTVLAQTAVGMLLVSEIARKTASGPVGAVLSRQLPAVGVLTAAALLLSLSHLGTPLHSVFTILNAGSSWLSREILAMGGFFAAVVALAVVRRRNPEAEATGLAVLTMLLGLVAVYVMSRVYMLVTVPVWDSVSTMLGFYGTALVAGSIAGGLLFGIQSNRDASLAGETRSRIAGVFILAALLGLGLKFVGVPLEMIALDSMNGLDVSGLAMLASDGTVLLVARMVLTFLGTAVFAWAAFRVVVSHENGVMINAGLCAFGLVLAGEIMGRLIFYGTYLRIGM